MRVVGAGIVGAGRGAAGENLACGRWSSRGDEDHVSWSLGDCGWRAHSSAVGPVPEESEMYAQAPRPLFVVVVAWCLVFAFAVGCGGGDNNNQTSVFVEGGGPPPGRIGRLFERHGLVDLAHGLSLALLRRPEAGHRRERHRRLLRRLVLRPVPPG